MLHTKFGTPMPETSEEFWELYQDSRMKFVPMWDEANREIEVPSYEVVAMLMRGWNLQPWIPEQSHESFVPSEPDDEIFNPYDKGGY